MLDEAAASQVLCLSPRERAALAWTEAVTQIAADGVPDALYDSVCAEFTEKEMVDLTMTVIAINEWNRLSITFRTEVGSYRITAERQGSACRDTPTA